MTFIKKVRRVRLFNLGNIYPFSAFTMLFSLSTQR